VPARKIPLSNDIRIEAVKYGNVLTRRDLSAMGKINLGRRCASFGVFPLSAGEARPARFELR